jgi:hypothetical protein
MARFYLSNGAVGLRRSEAEEALAPIPGGAVVLVDAAGVADFDPATNAALLADFDAGYARFSAAAGVLRRDGVNVVYAADAPDLAQKRGAYAGALRLPSNRQTTSNVLATVAGLSLQVEANSHYIFSFYGAYTAVGATTGLGLAVSGPAGPALVRMIACIAEGATAARQAAVGAYDTPVIGANSGGATAMPFWVDGNLSTGAAGGPLHLRFASETNGNAVTILAGSWAELRKVG